MIKQIPRTIFWIVLIFSALILSGLTWLIYFQDVPEGERVSWTTHLPLFNACCNALSFTFVVVGIRAIKKGNKQLHIVFMTVALLASAAFLGGYLTYHFFHGDTKYDGLGFSRNIYFFILITHILFSVIVLPQLLLSVIFAILRKWKLHKFFAKWTYPQWMYVSLTGVVVFLMLRVF